MQRAHQTLVIRGGTILSGAIAVNGAKNAALKGFAASLLSREPITLTRVPNIQDLDRSVELLRALGATVEGGNGTYAIETKNVTSGVMPADLVRKIRASIVVAGPLLGRTGEVTLPAPGGCVIGRRPIDLFLAGFEALGAAIEYENELFHLRAPHGLAGAKIVFPKISVTATETLMMTAVLAKGTTVLKNAACEPEIPALAAYLNAHGAKITGAGTHTITIEGTGEIGAGTYESIPDRLEAGSFAILGALAGGEITVTECNPEHLESLWAVFDRVGVDYTLGETFVTVRGNRPLKATDVQTHEYPGFMTDLQPPMTVLLTQAEGMSLMHESVWEGRLFYTDALNQMGARTIMCDPHRVIIQGPTPLVGRAIASPDIRAGFGLILAALVAEGTTEIDNIYQIDRGYANIDERLKKLGAHVERVTHE